MNNIVEYAVIAGVVIMVIVAFLRFRKDRDEPAAEEPKDGVSRGGGAGADRVE